MQYIERELGVCRKLHVSYFITIIFKDASIGPIGSCSYLQFHNTLFGWFQPSTDRPKFFWKTLFQETIYKTAKNKAKINHYLSNEMRHMQLPPSFPFWCSASHIISRVMCWCNASLIMLGMANGSTDSPLKCTTIKT